MIVSSRSEWLEVVRSCEALTSAEFRIAKSMPSMPHSYTLKRTWRWDAEFENTVRFIRKHGYPTKFFRNNYTYYDINGMHYWDNNDAVEKTELINRAVKPYKTVYDEIATEYDGLFDDKKSNDEADSLIEMAGISSSSSVLDIGCGTGLLLDRAKVGAYTGIDISSAMLSELTRKHPLMRGRAIKTSFDDFRGTGFDRIITLFGVASYLSPDSLKRIPFMLNDGGSAMLMFYAPDYSPVTYQRTAAEVPRAFPYTPEDGDFKVGNYIVRIVGAA